MLDNPTDLAFALGIDGIQLFRSGKRHEVWPILLQCYNLAPELRFQQDNVICCGALLPSSHI